MDMEIIPPLPRPFDRDIQIGDIDVPLMPVSSGGVIEVGAALRPN
jgi:hypothetical protein